MRWRFTLIHDVLGSQEITEPGGWKDHKKKLTRHPEFFSLVESLEAELVFYGRNDAEGVNGGIDFINQVEQNYGLNAQIRIFIELAEDDINFSDYWDGLMSIHALERFPDNTITCPVLKNNLWAKLLNRFDTPVDLSSTTTLDGTACAPALPVTVNLTPQIIRKKFEGHLLDTWTFDESELTTNDYVQLDVDQYDLDEIDEKHTIPIAVNPEVPAAGVISAEEGGVYTFDLRVELSIVYFNTAGTYPDCSLDRVVTGAGAYVNVYLQINDNPPIAFSEESSPLIFENISTIYTYTGALELNKADQIKIYADIVGDISSLGNAGATLWIHSKNGSGVMYVPQAIADVPSETCGFLPASEPTNVVIAAPSLEEFPTYFKITADTTFPMTEAEGYLIHDAFYEVIKRILT